MHALRRRKPQSLTIRTSIIQQKHSLPPLSDLRKGVQYIQAGVRANAHFAPTNCPVKQHRTVEGATMVTLDDISPHVKLSIGNDEANAVFGRGVAMLCRGVRDDGSLNKAAKNMGMAYSKAWRIMKQTEEAFGFNLINRDGAHGSTLTKEGTLLLSAFEQLERDVSTYAECHLPEIFKTL